MIKLFELMRGYVNYALPTEGLLLKRSQVVGRYVVYRMLAKLGNR